MTESRLSDAELAKLADWYEANPYQYEGIAPSLRELQEARAAIREVLTSEPATSRVYSRLFFLLPEEEP